MVFITDCPNCFVKTIAKMLLYIRCNFSYLRVSAKLSNSSIFVSISFEDFFDWRIQTPLETSVKTIFIITLSAFCSTARAISQNNLSADRCQICHVPDSCWDPLVSVSAFKAYPICQFGQGKRLLRLSRSRYFHTLLSLRGALSQCLTFSSKSVKANALVGINLSRASLASLRFFL